MGSCQVGMRIEVKGMCSHCSCKGVGLGSGRLGWVGSRIQSRMSGYVVGDSGSTLPWFSNQWECIPAVEERGKKGRKLDLHSYLGENMEYDNENTFSQAEGWQEHISMVHRRRKWWECQK